MELIEDVLRTVEREFCVTILFAVEAGSRATGLHSDSSDFDVRFVYFHNSRVTYLSLCDPVECISGFSHNKIVDWQGWDIRKYLKLLRQTNPTAVEWVYSPVVYINRCDLVDLAAQSRDRLETQKYRVPLVFHYASMARRVFLSDIDGRLRASTKKYLYVVRGVLMMEWQFFQSSRDVDECTSALLNLDFRSVFTALSEVIPHSCASWVLHAMEMKLRAVDEMDRVPALDDWMRSCLEPANLNTRIKLVLKEKKTLPVAVFDDFFLKVFELCS